jgi:nucleotide-binding universal stress UspA family protein
MKKILVAYDGTEAADHALTTAISLSKAFQAEVGVISVVPVHPGRAPIDPWDDPSVHAEQLQKARGILLGAGIEPALMKPAGDPAKLIEEEAETGGYDAIVIGSRGQGFLARAFQGSVSEHVATHARSTVIVTR